MSFKELLKSKGFTQKKLVKELNNKECYKYQQQISEWCSGKRLPDLMSAYHISRILDVTIDELVKSFLSGVELLCK